MPVTLPLRPGNLISVWSALFFFFSTWIGVRPRLRSDDTTASVLGPSISPARTAPLRSRTLYVKVDALIGSSS